MFVAILSDARIFIYILCTAVSENYMSFLPASICMLNWQLACWHLNKITSYTKKRAEGLFIVSLDFALFMDCLSLLTDKPEFSAKNSFSFYVSGSYSDNWVNAHFLIAFVNKMYGAILFERMAGRRIYFAQKSCL